MVLQAAERQEDSRVAQEARASLALAARALKQASTIPASSRPAGSCAGAPSQYSRASSEADELDLISLSKCAQSRHSQASSEADVLDIPTPARHAHPKHSQASSEADELDPSHDDNREPEEPMERKTLWKMKPRSVSSIDNFRDALTRGALLERKQFLSAPHTGIYPVASIHCFSPSW